MSPKFPFALVLSVLLISLTGCGDSHEKIMNDRISLIKQMNKEMKELSTSGDVQKSIELMKGYTEKMKELEKRSDALGSPSKEEREELSKKYFEAMKEFGKDFKLPK